ncbi:MAG: vWA domain-containing protein [Candidatus Diapherotrites archaeon]
MYSKTKNNKGFVLTVDAIMALLIVVAFLLITQIQPYDSEPYIAKLSTNERAADLFISLDENGFLTGVMDENLTADLKMDTIYNKMLSVVPSNMDFRIELTRYDANELNCRLNPYFDGCFTLVDIYPERGTAIPTDKDLISGATTFMRGQPPGQCEIAEVEFADEFSYAPENERLLFNAISETDRLSFSAEPYTLFFAEGDLNFLFSVDVTPSDELECDEELRVDLTLEVTAEGGRAPLDMMLVLDRTESMEDCVVADGTIETYEVNVTALDWELVDTIDLTSADAFDVLIEWTDSCSLANCPKMYIESPSLDHYGFGYSTTNAYECHTSGAVNYYEDDSFSYIAVPSNMSEVGTWNVYVKKNNPQISYALTTKFIDAPLSKLESMKTESVNFIYNAEWQPDDQIGYVSFERRAKKESPLPSSRGAVQNKIQNTTTSGTENTAMGDGIDVANGELTGPQAQDDALKFEILLSDGETTIGMSSEDAANDAADNNISIFTIAFGPDANQMEMQNIADITGGEMYYAKDENALKEVYEIIAQKIGLEAQSAASAKAYDANATVPLPLHSFLVDPGSGVFEEGTDRNYLFYNIGTVTVADPWEGYFIVTFPCDNDFSCENDVKYFPEEPFYVYYYDDLGIPQDPVLWDGNFEITFLYRDLTVDFISGEIRGYSEIYLDLNAINSGFLDTGATTVELYYDDVYTGEYITDRSVVPMCGMFSSGCDNYFQVFNELFIENGGHILAIINKDKSIKECPGNNIAEIYCYVTPRTQFYILKYWLWYK